MDAAESMKPFVASFLASAPVDVRGRDVGCWELGDEPEVVDARLERVKAGYQRASAGLLWLLDAHGEDPPRCGDLRVLRDAQGQAQAVVEVLESQVVPFGQVDEHFAVDVGEGDLSLTYWRRSHGQVFERQCRSLGYHPSDTMPVVCLRFRLVYPRLLGA